MPTRPPTTRARLRAAAVASVLAVGVAASLATTPPPEDCPDPPAESAVSEFYGQQETDYGGSSQTGSPQEFTAGGFHVVGVSARTPSCLDADDSVAEVRIHLDLAEDEPGPVPEATLHSLRVQDGRGRTWSPREVHTREQLPPTSEGGDPYPSFASAMFALPVQLEPPVTLQLGDLGDATLAELTLWDPGASPAPGAS